MKIQVCMLKVNNLVYVIDYKTVPTEYMSKSICFTGRLLLLSRDVSRMQNLFRPRFNYLLEIKGKNNHLKLLTLRTLSMEYICPWKQA